MRNRAAHKAQNSRPPVNTGHPKAAKVFTPYPAAGRAAAKSSPGKIPKCRSVGKQASLRVHVFVYRLLLDPIISEIQPALCNFGGAKRPAGPIVSLSPRKSFIAGIACRAKKEIPKHPVRPDLQKMHVRNKRGSLLAVSHPKLCHDSAGIVSRLLIHTKTPQSLQSPGCRAAKRHAQNPPAPSAGKALLCAGAFSRIRLCSNPRLFRPRRPGAAIPPAPSPENIWDRRKDPLFQLFLQ